MCQEINLLRDNECNKHPQENISHYQELVMGLSWEGKGEKFDKRTPASIKKTFHDVDQFVISWIRTIKEKFYEIYSINLWLKCPKVTRWLTNEKFMLWNKSAKCKSHNEWSDALS
ncbi:CLUMA_CG019209, isoform A [Clunio marinus]|uniref:CLUMA_CG019209, isoform A n=1 Tax=Clunio marinus TaxID=568069 RepID=A0A1J1J0S1_9DIPT|nr:CLUMA_CG019209, isoform A [Clunio marinus]